MEKDSLNDGHVKEVTPDMFEKAANDFSEGNEALKKLLEYCFENGIKTQACCSGHEGKKMPYIQFELDENNMGAILKMLKHLSLGDIITNFSFVKQPGVTSHFHVSMDKDKYNEGFEQILGALQQEKEVEISDLDNTTQQIVKSMQKHSVLNSYMEIGENKDNISIAVDSQYSMVLPYNGKEKPWTENTQIIEGRKDSFEINRTLRKLEASTKNYEFMKKHPYNKEKIENFWNNKDNARAIQINALATRERQGEYHESNVVSVDISLGSRLEDVVEQIMQLQQAGQACVTRFNSFEIDSRDNTSAEEILEAYNKDWEMHQVRRKEETEDISLDEIREATEELTPTRVFGVTKEVKEDVKTKNIPEIGKSSQEIRE